jgi:ferric-dicitrate binding protein FerR (iron transport regulator)
MQKSKNNYFPEDLITGYLMGELTPVEREKLMNWIGSDPENKKYFDEYCEVWITARAGVKHPEYNFQKGFWKFKQRITDEPRIIQTEHGFGLFREILKYAAIVLITASVTSLTVSMFWKNKLPGSGQTISELIVPMGSNARFSFSDGTTVTLNAGSKLTFDNSYGIDDRVVTLEGEGFFTVAKDTERPFIVKTSHLNVLALGTSFNIKAYSNDKTIETTLVEGSVKIEGIAEQETDEVTILMPNQRFVFYKDESGIAEEQIAEKAKVTPAPSADIQRDTPVPRAITENVNIEPVISWKEPRWIFEKQSLEQIAVDLERKFDVKIIFGSERLKEFRFTGTLLAEPIEQVLEVMSLSAPINFSLKGNVVTLSENRNFRELNRRLYNRQ